MRTFEYFELGMIDEVDHKDDVGGEDEFPKLHFNYTSTTSMASRDDPAAPKTEGPSSPILAIDGFELARGCSAGHLVARPGLARRGALLASICEALQKSGISARLFYIAPSDQERQIAELFFQSPQLIPLCSNPDREEGVVIWSYRDLYRNLALVGKPHCFRAACLFVLEASVVGRDIWDELATGALLAWMRDESVARGDDETNVLGMLAVSGHVLAEEWYAVAGEILGKQVTRCSRIESEIEYPTRQRVCRRLLDQMDTRGARLASEVRQCFDGASYGIQEREDVDRATLPPAQRQPRFVVCVSDESDFARSQNGLLGNVRALYVPAQGLSDSDLHRLQRFCNEEPGPKLLGVDPRLTLLFPLSRVSAVVVADTFRKTTFVPALSLPARTRVVRTMAQMRHAEAFAEPAAWADTNGVAPVKICYLGDGVVVEDDAVPDNIRESQGARITEWLWWTQRPLPSTGRPPHAHAVEPSCDPRVESEVLRRLEVVDVVSPRRHDAAAQAATDALMARLMTELGDFQLASFLLPCARDAVMPAMSRRVTQVLVEMAAAYLTWREKAFVVSFPGIWDKNDPALDVETEDTVEEPSGAAPLHPSQAEMLDQASRCAAIAIARLNCKFGGVAPQNKKTGRDDLRMMSNWASECGGIARTNAGKGGLWLLVGLNRGPVVEALVGEAVDKQVPAMGNTLRLDLGGFRRMRQAAARLCRALDMHPRDILDTETTTDSLPLRPGEAATIDAHLLCSFLFDLVLVPSPHNAPSPRRGSSPHWFVKNPVQRQRFGATEKGLRAFVMSSRYPVSCPGRYHTISKPRWIATFDPDYDFHWGTARRGAGFFALPLGMAFGSRMGQAFVEGATMASAAALRKVEWQLDTARRGTGRQFSGEFMRLQSRDKFYLESPTMMWVLTVASLDDRSDETTVRVPVFLDGAGSSERVKEAASQKRYRSANAY
ncbi:hypothetical protein B0T26DRAFT_675893 [Lasiosphaeria miniovina]|uniref:Uncharacterized protein n=1 Tax=Lasiosphaeria miniovina TaxID=1954250 RepID=A0AA40AKP7_9PEZI|nr:uncharacterized protein B0T26DRAFT_675893 [Lasiosphaeria miniovina]KAK0717617.1 hypothetical protein B0T26DRAFT_675893 [Lasiosphaeria miniovina]